MASQPFLWIIILNQSGSHIRLKLNKFYHLFSGPVLLDSAAGIWTPDRLRSIPAWPRKTSRISDQFRKPAPGKIFWTDRWSRAAHRRLVWRRRRRPRCRRRRRPSTTLSTCPKWRTRSRASDCFRGVSSGTTIPGSTTKCCSSASPSSRVTPVTLCITVWRRRDGRCSFPFTCKKSSCGWGRIRTRDAESWTGVSKFVRSGWTPLCWCLSTTNYKITSWAKFQKTSLTLKINNPHK